MTRTGVACPMGWSGFNGRAWQVWAHGFSNASQSLELKLSQHPFSLGRPSSMKGGTAADRGDPGAHRSRDELRAIA